MPDLNTTRKDIESFVATNIVTIPIAYDNIDFDESSVGEYAYLSIHFTYSRNVNTGAINYKRIRHEGAIVFKIYSPIDSGTSLGLTRMDEIKTQVENKYISPNLITYAAEPQREGVSSEGYFTYFLRIPFVSDEC